MYNDMQRVENLMEALKEAIVSENKKEIMRMYTAINKEADWDEMPESLYEKYDKLVDQGNDIIYS